MNSLKNRIKLYDLCQLLVGNLNKGVIGIFGVISVDIKLTLHGKT